MGGVGSGNHKDGRPDKDEIEAARLEISRIVSRANREGAKECLCTTENLRLLLYGIIKVTAENVNLTRELKHASVDTHPKDGDVEQAPLVSGAVPERQTPDV